MASTVPLHFACMLRLESLSLQEMTPLTSQSPTSQRTSNLSGRMRAAILHSTLCSMERGSMGTYSVENYGARGFPSPAPDCGNWCIMGPFCGIRTSIDGGATWTPDPFRNMTGFADNIFGERADNNTKVKFGAPHAVDFGQENAAAPNGALYIIGTGAEWASSHQSWMQGDSVYLARTIGRPAAATINNASSWEFWGGESAGWLPHVSSARPLFVWRQKTGVVTASFIPALNKFIIAISTPTNGSSTVDNFDTYFLESDVLTGPYSLVTYLSSFGPEAYFVNLPSKFLSAAPTNPAESASWLAKPAAPQGSPIVVPFEGATDADVSTAYYSFFLSYSANFAHQLGPANPPGSGYHWSLLRSRFKLSAAFAGKLRVDVEAATLH